MPWAQGPARLQAGHRHGVTASQGVHPLTYLQLQPTNRMPTLQVQNVTQRCCMFSLIGPEAENVLKEIGGVGRVCLGGRYGCATATAGKRPTRLKGAASTATPVSQCARRAPLPLLLLP